MTSREAGHSPQKGELKCLPTLPHIASKSLQPTKRKLALARYLRVTPVWRTPAKVSVILVEKSRRCNRKKISYLVLRALRAIMDRRPRDRMARGALLEQPFDKVAQSGIPLEGIGYTGKEIEKKGRGGSMRNDRETGYR